MTEICRGFAPAYFEDSRLLILGSFPSVKSRQNGFYYGNPLNRFWKVLAQYFGDCIPKTNEEKLDLLKRRRVALWDIVTECEICGSQDASIKNYRVADLIPLLQNSKIGYIILNGSKAFDIYEKYYGNLNIPHIKLPSTSTANTRFDEKEWYNAISAAFERT